MIDRLGNEIEIGSIMIFSAGSSVEAYEILKLKEGRLDKVYVNVGSTKKWKIASDGIVYTEINNSVSLIDNRLKLIGIKTWSINLFLNEILIIMNLPNIILWSILLQNIILLF